jgi:D-alanine-D-alanine ligase
VITLPITEIISGNEFFDYAAKYEGASEEITPANLEEKIADQIRETAKKAYQVFNCRGVVRIDFIFNEKENSAYLLEINTVPGQSAASIVPQQVKAMGWSLREFYSALIEACLPD